MKNKIKSYYGIFGCASYALELVIYLFGLEFSIPINRKRRNINKYVEE